MTKYHSDDEIRSGDLLLEELLLQNIRISEKTLEKIEESDSSLGRLLLVIHTATTALLVFNIFLSLGVW